MFDSPIILPFFDPSIITIGPLAIRWYSLAYIIGIFAVWFLLKKFGQNSNKKDNILSKEALDDWFVWAVLGILIGGRLGYVFFYNLSFYAQNPLQALAVWQGGMSFHGGLLGAIASMFLFAKKYQINFLKLTDILSIGAPIGLFLGRIANFINLELYGRVTDSKWGMIFPNASPLPRHASQLYEAFLEGLLLFIILFSLAKFTQIRNKAGFLSGLFLVLYAAARTFIEQFREPDAHIGLLLGGQITMGQILSLPIAALGVFVIFKSLKPQQG
jgi:phosphatidylglycerol---prolipoprotein diacylglyceryl transferase